MVAYDTKESNPEDRESEFSEVRPYDLVFIGSGELPKTVVKNVKLRFGRLLCTFEGTLYVIHSKKHERVFLFIEDDEDGEMLQFVQYGGRNTVLNFISELIAGTFVVHFDGCCENCGFRRIEDHKNTSGV